jgi:hypothetical protein
LPALSLPKCHAFFALGCLGFRHSFGTELAMKGESLYKVSGLMGNSPEICRKHYAALIPKSLSTSVELLQPTDSDKLAADKGTHENQSGTPNSKRLHPIIRHLITWPKVDTFRVPKNDSECDTN